MHLAIGAEWELSGADIFGTFRPMRFVRLSIHRFKKVHMHIMVVYCPKTCLELSSVNDWPVVYRIQVLNFRAHGSTETCRNNVNTCSVAANTVSGSSFWCLFQRPKPVVHYSAVLGGGGQLHLYFSPLQDNEHHPTNQTTDTTFKHSLTFVKTVLVPRVRSHKARGPIMGD